jgi:hypothetical protein
MLSIARKLTQNMALHHNMDRQVNDTNCQLNRLHPPNQSDQVYRRRVRLPLFHHHYLAVTGPVLVLVLAPVLVLVLVLVLVPAPDQAPAPVQPASRRYPVNC